MTKVRNLATAPITLVDRSGKGHTVRPDEVASVNYDANNEHNIQMFAMGAVEEAKDAAATSSKAPAKRASRPRKAAAKKAAPPESGDTSSGD